MVLFKILKVSLKAGDNEPARCLYLKYGFYSVQDLEVAPDFSFRFFEKKLNGRKVLATKFDNAA